MKFLTKLPRSRKRSGNHGKQFVWDGGVWPNVSLAYQVWFAWKKPRVVWELRLLPMRVSSSCQAGDLTSRYWSLQMAKWTKSDLCVIVKIRAISEILEGVLPLVARWSRSNEMKHPTSLPPLVSTPWPVSPGKLCHLTVAFLMVFSDTSKVWK